MSTLVVNCRIHEYDVFIGRPSIWGNPFRIGQDGPRDRVIELYAEWLAWNPRLLKRISELRDKRLGCFCTREEVGGSDLPWRCHGQVLAYLADGGVLLLEGMLMEDWWKAWEGDVSRRVEVCRLAGLEGKVGSKTWRSLTNVERVKIAGALRREFRPRTKMHEGGK